MVNSKVRPSESGRLVFPVISGFFSRYFLYTLARPYSPLGLHFFFLFIPRTGDYSPADFLLWGGYINPWWDSAFIR